MKWMIASDIHGSAYFGEKLADRFEKEGAQRLLLLGDLLYHGPRNDLPRGYAPKELIPILNHLKEKIVCRFEKEGAQRLLLLGDLLYHGPRNDLPRGYAPKELIPILNHLKEKIVCVRGNCDTEVDQMVLEFPILSDYAVFVLGNTTIYATHGHIYHEENMLPLEKGQCFLYGHTHIEFPILSDYAVFVLGNTTIYATHGHIYHEENMLPLEKGQCFLYGHTHIPEMKQKNGYLFLNPGSVSIPKGGSQNSYMIYEDGMFRLVTLDGAILTEHASI